MAKATDDPMEETLKAIQTRPIARAGRFDELATNPPGLTAHMEEFMSDEASRDWVTISLSGRIARRLEITG